MKNLFKTFCNKLEFFSVKFQDLSLLFLRLILAYGFFSPAVSKWNDIEAVANWFQSMGYPFPHFNAYLVATVEAIGVILLLIGLGTRLISLLLIFVMFVAITTVHLKLGFDASGNGFEIPLYYALMLFVLFTYGSGKYAVDYFLKKNS